MKAIENTFEPIAKVIPAAFIALVKAEPGAI